MAPSGSSRKSSSRRSSEFAAGQALDRLARLRARKHRAAHAPVSWSSRISIIAERAVETRPGRAPAPAPAVRNEVHAGPKARQPAKLAAMPASAAATPDPPAQQEQRRADEPDDAPAVTHEPRHRGRVHARELLDRGRAKERAGSAR